MLNPVAAHRLLEVLNRDDVLQDSSVSFDRFDRSDIVHIARDQEVLDAKFLECKLNR
jgi:hypothetical protein